MSDVLFPYNCLPTLKEERRIFFLVEFIFAVTSWHVRQNLPASVCVRWRLSPPKHSFCAESFFWGVGLVEDHNVGGTSLNISVSWSFCVQGHYLLTVNVYFFVSAIKFFEISAPNP